MNRVMRRAAPIAWMLAVLALTACSVSIHAVPSVTPPASTPAGSPSLAPSTASLAPSTSATQVAPPTPTSPATPTPDETSTPPVPTSTRLSTALPVTQGPQATTPAPTPTPIPPAPTPTEEPTPSGPPQCANVPVRGFGLLWTEEPGVAQTIGCPQASEVGLAAKVQPFANGMMVWLDTETAGVDSSAWVLTLIGSRVTRYRIPQDVPTWVDGSTDPSGAFAWVWDNVYTVRQALGNPTDSWYATAAAYQLFDQGTMIWLKSVPDAGTPMIYVVAVDLTHASSGAFQRYADRSGQ